MKTDRMQNLMFSMLPDENTKAEYEGGLAFYGNIGANERPGYIYSDPLKYPLRTDFLLLFLCEEGELHLRLNLEDYVIRKHQMACVIPGTVCESMSTTADIQLAAIMVSSQMYQLFPLGEMMSSLQGMSFVKPVICDLTPEQFSYLIDIYLLMRRTLVLQGLENREGVLRGHFLAFSTLATDILRSTNFQQPAVKLSRADEIYSQFIHDVRNHFRQHRDVLFYAGQQFVSPKYFGQVIIQASGKHPADIIRENVILEAKVLLRSRKHSVAEVASLLNFSDQSSFGKYFKQAVGCSPRNYTELADP